MPSFSHHWPKADGGPDADKLELSGPSLNIEISLHPTHAKSLIDSGSDVSPPTAGIGLIDTGAGATCVEEKILKKLGIPAIDSQPIWTPDGPGNRSVYPCKISYPGTPLPPSNFNSVLGVDLTGFGCQALIGRDILRDCQFVYNGVQGTWTLAF